jgi:hypothetical protein
MIVLDVNVGRAGFKHEITTLTERGLPGHPTRPIHHRDFGDLTTYSDII